MKAPPFAYARARHLAEVFDLLERHGEAAKILAGGQSLMPTLNMRLSSPELLIDISRIQEHAGMGFDELANLQQQLTRVMGELAKAAKRQEGDTP